MTKDDLEEKIYKAIKYGEQMDYDREDNLVPVYKRAEVRDDVVIIAIEWAKEQIIELDKWMRKYKYILQENGFYSNEPPTAGKQTLFTIEELYTKFIEHQSQQP